MRDNGADDGTIAFSRSKVAFGMAKPDTRRLKKTQTNGHSAQSSLFESGSAKSVRRAPILPAEDNTPEGLQALLKANSQYRGMPWPEPYRRTTHHLRLGDAPNLSWIPYASVPLMVTSPPYWTPKKNTAVNSDQ